MYIQRTIHQLNIVIQANKASEAIIIIAHLNVFFSSHLSGSLICCSETLFAELKNLQNERKQPNTDRTGPNTHGIVVSYRYERKPR